MSYTLTQTEHSSITFYGIKYEGEDGTLYVPDICSDRQSLALLCEKLSKGDVTLVTLMDIIQDFIS